MARPTCADYAACCRLEARRVAAGFLACLGAGAVGCGLDASGLETARVSFRFSRASARTQWSMSRPGWQPSCCQSAYALAAISEWVGEGVTGLGVSISVVIVARQRGGVVLFVYDPM